MRMTILAVLAMTLPTAWAIGGGLDPDRVKPLADQAMARFDAAFTDLLSLYKDLHAHPELSHQEVRTAGVLAEKMRMLGFEVTQEVGGTGVVAVLENGPGPVVMVRTDMDALPVVEATGLDYASKMEVRRPDGSVVGVMHACGHDMHMACWVGTARMLSEAKNLWSGTLVFIGQPAEELGEGARRMLDDGLFERFPKPDYGFALHCDTLVAAGDIGFTEGFALANVDSVDILVKGRGGHGAHPHATIDPVVLAARIVTDLQTIISREIDPLDAGVITVGSIHGGTKHNIIPNEVKLQLTVRSFKDETRQLLLDGIKRVAGAAALSMRAPEPEVTVDPSFTPATFNDISLTQTTVDRLRQVLGDERLVVQPPVMGGEDFSRYSRAGTPCVMLRLGTMPAERLAAFRAGKEILPSLHSDQYYPIPEPSLRTGVRAMVGSVLGILGKASP